MEVNERPLADTSSQVAGSDIHTPAPDSMDGNPQAAPQAAPELLELAGAVRQIGQDTGRQFRISVGLGILSIVLATFGVYLSIHYKSQSDASFQRMESLSTPLLYDGVRKVADSLHLNFSTIRDPRAIAQIWTAFLRGDHRGLAKLSRQYFQRFPRDANVYLLVALDELNRNNNGRAISLLDTAIMFAPRYAAAYNNRAIAKMNLGSLAGALLDLETATLINPSYPMALNNKGNCLRLLRRYAEAESALVKADTLDTTNVSILLNLSLVYSDQGRLEKAESTLSVAIRRDPRYAEAYAQRGGVRLVMLRRTSLAVEPTGLAAQDIERAISLNPNEPACFRARALLRFSMGDRKGASSDWTAATRLDPTDAVSRFWLAELYFENGRLDSAVAQYSAALRHPRFLDSSQVKHARARLSAIEQGELRNVRDSGK